MTTFKERLLEAAEKQPKKDKKKIEKLKKEVEEEKELLDKLKNPPQFSPFDSDMFTNTIAQAAQAAQTTAQVNHDFEMKRIKAKLVADLCVKIVETSEYYEPKSVAQVAREIAENALENI